MYAQGCGAGGGGVGGRSPEGEGDDEGGEGDEEEPPLADPDPEPLLRCDTGANSGYVSLCCYFLCRFVYTQNKNGAYKDND